MYRTGRLWAHSAMPADCQPDVVTMAKPLANGYPIGAVLMRDSVAEVMTAGKPPIIPPVQSGVGLNVKIRYSWNDVRRIATGVRAGLPRLVTGL